ncbi:MAG: hypothetical protein KC416_17045, partial [Myxococcales bacterium]|nr:hypothetical protein [Myxococcales bacterium]
MVPMPKNTVFLLALLLVAIPALPAASQPAEPPDVPEVLRPWVPWVVESLDDYGCSYEVGGRVCLFPGELLLEVHGGEAKFTQMVVADRKGEVGLPGGELWPEEVTLDGRPAPVVGPGGDARLTVPAGQHRVSGVLRWDRMPDTLIVPATVGRILVRSGPGAPRLAHREADGRIWLHARDGGGETEEEDRLSLDVQRKVADGVPLRVTTRLELRVSGKAREILLGKVSLPGTIPLDVKAELPVHLDAEGNLRVQARAGVHEIVVTARTEGVPESLVLPKREDPWPAGETWVWVADEQLRHARLSGVPGVDPSRTRLPEEW